MGGVQRTTPGRYECVTEPQGGGPVDQTFFWGVNIRSSGEAKCVPVSRSYPGVFYFTLGIF